uniref:Uncharacterized protein n=2 Tax=Nothobranchius furzeri TaxID=105023 RepID=A0A1A7ZDZ6_NOTFU
MFQQENIWEKREPQRDFVSGSVRLLSPEAAAGRPNRFRPPGRTGSWCLGVGDSLTPLLSGETKGERDYGSASTRFLSCNEARATDPERAQLTSLIGTGRDGGRGSLPDPGGPGPGLSWRDAPAAAAAAAEPLPGRGG